MPDFGLMAVDCSALECGCWAFGCLAFNSAGCWNAWPILCFRLVERASQGLFIPNELYATDAENQE